MFKFLSPVEQVQHTAFAGMCLCLCSTPRGTIMRPTDPSRSNNRGRQGLWNQKRSKGDKFCDIKNRRKVNKRILTRVRPRGVRGCRPREVCSGDRGGFEGSDRVRFVGSGRAEPARGLVRLKVVELKLPR